jgi:hypothetical protein
MITHHHHHTHTLLGELFCRGKNQNVKNDHKSFLRENWFEMIDLFSSLLIFTIIKLQNKISSSINYVDSLAVFTFDIL